MDFIYLLLLSGVALAIFSALFEAIAAINRKPTWQEPAAKAPQLELVETIDRRKQQLPYVGQDRRGSAERAAAHASAAPEEERHTA